MKSNSSVKIKSILQLYELLPQQERIIVDVLRQIVTENLPANCKEKISFSVPYFYGNKGICIIWPAGLGSRVQGIVSGFVARLKHRLRAPAQRADP